MGYASRTGTRRNLDALRRAGWRLLLSPTGVHSHEGFRYCLDNGAWTAYQQGTPWNFGAFVRLVTRFGYGADFVVVPDVVADAAATIRRTAVWLPILDGIGRRRLVAVQDGMTDADVKAWLSDDVGIFLGGSTEWKWSTVYQWGELAHRVGCYFHVGRVNSRRLVLRCSRAGADSFDGTSASMYASTTPGLDGARRQGALPLAW